GGRDYIVRNPRTTLQPPKGIPLAKMDSTQQECEVWTEDQRISNFDRLSWHPKIAVSRDTIHVVWNQDLEGPHEEVCYSRSTDGGETWEDSIVLSLIDNHESFQQDITVEHNNVYVVWFDLSSGQESGIYLRKSTNGGGTWTNIEPVALSGPDYFDYYRPAIAAKDSEVFVAFGKNVEQDGMLKFKKSTDYGETWSQEIHISDRAVSGHWAKMVLNSVGLYVAYQNGLSIWCNRSTDWGDTWSDDIFISDMEGSIAQWPSIAADDNGGVYISWFDYKYSPYPWTGDIFLRRSTDNGETWDSIMILTNNHLCHESDVCADKHSVLTVWRDDRYDDLHSEIYGRRSKDQGASWLPEQRLTNAPYQSYDPRIITSSSWVHMVWSDARDGRADVFHKKGVWYLRGDPNKDNIIDVADVVYLINYLFVGGPPPIVFESGDVNDDDQINVADIVYLINYLFVGGPGPAEC
ncbi:MAG: dockerin type I domain-containing protein, partial [bacterium]